eukprot:1565864-Lingulodinium_polyedra.AAC.1
MRVVHQVVSGASSRGPCALSALMAEFVDAHVNYTAWYAESVAHSAHSVGPNTLGIMCYEMSNALNRTYLT